MSARSTQYRDSPWYRLVRCLVVLYVAALERRIARLLVAMDALPMDPRFDAEFARLDDRCYGLECLRDHYVAWLEDPEVGLPRLLQPHDDVLPRGFTLARRLGARVVMGRVRVRARGGGRCTTTSLRPFDRPARCAGAAGKRAR